MVTSAFTHASILAYDLEESLQFYEQVFGMERVPSPIFPDADVAWLRCGDRTLHLFERDIDAADYYHVGLHVDDFASVYEAAEKRDLMTDFDEGESLPTVYELPEGAVQMYIEDPAGNLVEINYHDVEDLPEDVREDVVRRSDQVRQTGDASESRLYLDGLLAAIGAESGESRAE